jgi:hypothetical protein
MLMLFVSEAALTEAKESSEESDGEPNHDAHQPPQQYDPQ